MIFQTIHGGSVGVLLRGVQIERLGTGNVGAAIVVATLALLFVVALCVTFLRRAAVSGALS